MKIVVTGGSGKAGRAVVRDLLEHGHDVLYVDQSHVAQACRLGLEADISGAEAFVIAAGDTVMQTPSRELMAQVFPGVPVRDGVDRHDTLLGIDKARRGVGYSPPFTWRGLFLWTR